MQAKQQAVIRVLLAVLHGRGRNEGVKLCSAVHGWKVGAAQTPGQLTTEIARQKQQRSAVQHMQRFLTSARQHAVLRVVARWKTHTEQQKPEAAVQSVQETVALLGLRMSAVVQVAAIRQMQGASERIRRGMHCCTPLHHLTTRMCCRYAGPCSLGMAASPRNVAAAVSTGHVSTDSTEDAARCCTAAADQHSVHEDSGAAGAAAALEA